MNFVSYAQKYEDVLLWRALRHIKNGFYIDVGANDPEIYSVTKSFYERGWCGINIEPMPDFCQRFEQERPRDINLSMAAGAQEGQITIFDVPARRGWASFDRAVAEHLQKLGFEIVELQVPIRTLTSICQEHVTGAIHFLKVDVEGFETDVLRGMDFIKWRPWVVVVEATLPNSRIPNYQQWENLLTEQDYQFAYSDGINRFYVAGEHVNLLGNLQVQVIFLDEYTLLYAAKMWEAENDTKDAIYRERALEVGLNHALEQAQQAQAHAQQAEAHAQQVQASTDAALAATTVWAHNNAALLTQIEASLSWRVTRPLRAINHGFRRHIFTDLFLLRWLRQLRQLRQLLPGLKLLAKKAVRWVISREVLRRSIMPQLARQPWLDAKVNDVVNVLRDRLAAPPRDPISAELREPIRDLPLSARKVLADLAGANQIKSHL